MSTPAAPPASANGKLPESGANAPPPAPPTPPADEAPIELPPKLATRLLQIASQTDAGQEAMNTYAILVPRVDAHLGAGGMLAFRAERVLVQLLPPAPPGQRGPGR